jgi:hypothetical protein
MLELLRMEGKREDGKGREGYEKERWRVREGRRIVSEGWYVPLN